MMVQPTACSPTSWSSTHDDFRCLRFLVWTGGDPGFTLTTSTGSEESAEAIPLDEDAELRVDRVTALKVWEAGIRPGDVLETVSGKRVHTMDTEAAIVLVQMSKSPSIIRFRSATLSKRVRFDVLLGRQKLGVFFTGDGSRDVPVVSRIGSQNIQTFTGDSSSPSGIRLGDILGAVNGQDAVAAGLSTMTKYLETCPRPVRLTFERDANEDDTNGWFDSQTASEEPGEHRRRSFSLRSAIPRMAMPTVTREAASLRCREFLRALMPSGVGYPQSEGEKHTCSHETKRSEVLIEWKNGPLGLTLLEDAISGAAVVNRLTGKGSSANIERLQHGFLLYSINGVRTDSRPLDDLYRDLLALPKPVQLVFRPPGFNDTSEEDSSEHSSSLSPSTTPEVSPNVETGLNENAHRAVVKTSTIQHRCPQQASKIREQYEYEVVWTTSQLGLQLEIPHASAAGKTSTRRQYPMVHKILKESTLGLPSDAVGHLFISVNNWSTSGLSTTELRTLLRVATRPTVLRFRRQEGLPGFQRTFLSSSSYDTDDEALQDRNAMFGSAYSILWSEGKLGIVFGCYEDADRQNTLVVYVKHIGPGQAQNSNLVSVGDILRSINGQDLPPKQKFKKTMRSLINTRQPVTLGFRRLLVERCSD
ncbi:hypothetical protein PC129_g6255 [Phytophthora cactorum]|uniref:PDZ domain-containing protein n=1 Tax=Phytophthora cactorum TaxID=29920 RepID=A0A329SZU3_9STRA|nr:hypothetical protein Pcac1_g17463 [Phytophthora cactorum]KAG2831271.1 hypothetical protein PC111_g7074 [Phytophthora cactorum]KAG2912954.1 hypothetical protein PC114_g8724 [Phytophthora cactorum]KAG3174758.1 hypothetical protein C6341_g9701 [Phytophthora cactorum]KAG3223072.1 hypothetical protein PC129_g6255 [Phytophthora cactorum]